MQTTLMEVTPALAAEWLTKNGKNRPLGKRRVSLLAAAIRRGEWKVTHQGIAFGSDGLLTDGQHRLAAIVDAGIPVTMLVSRDVDAFDAIDIGRPRSASDILGIAGFTNTRITAACLRLIYAYDNSMTRLGFDQLRKEVSIAQIEVLAHEIADDVNRRYTVAHATYGRLGGSSSAFCSADFIAGRWAAKTGLGREFSEDWFEGLRSGANLVTGDPRLAVASWVQNAGQRIANSSLAAILMMSTLRAFHATVTGEPLSRLLIRDPRTFSYRLPGDGQPSMLRKDDGSLSLEEATR
jgi:hypothetical protein